MIPPRTPIERVIHAAGLYHRGIFCPAETWYQIADATGVSWSNLMAYLNYLLSVPEGQIDALRKDASFLLTPTKVAGVSHLLGYWVKVEPLAMLLGKILDGGEIVNAELWHPLRAPVFHRPAAVKDLYNRLAETWKKTVSAAQRRRLLQLVQFWSGQAAYTAGACGASRRMRSECSGAPRGSRARQPYAHSVRALSRLTSARNSARARSRQPRLRRESDGCSLPGCRCSSRLCSRQSACVRGGITAHDVSRS